jgi:hypothetical protein
MSGSVDHATRAQQLLSGLEPITSAASGQAETRALAASAHALLALNDQVAALRRDLAIRAGWDPDQL